jgi:serine/threonine-protein kinase RsbW
MQMRAALCQEAEAVPISTRKTMNASRDAGQVPFLDVIIPSDASAARQVQDRIEALLQERRASDNDIFSIRLALEEALINAIKHGNQLDQSKKVKVSFRVQGDRFEVHISDEGSGFDPADVPDPTAMENLERPCGRGLMLMRYYMNEVSFSPQGNSVSMCRVFRNGKK